MLAGSAGCRSGEIVTVSPVDLRLDGPGDNVDDPCFWVDPVDASKSLVFVTAKDSGLVEAYEVATGKPAGIIKGFGVPNNCAVEGDLLLTTDRKPPEVKVHHVPDFALVRSFGSDLQIPEGVDVLTLPNGQRLVYVTDSGDVSVHVYDLTTGELVRSFPTGFGLKIEPILADDAHQRIFVAREEKGPARHRSLHAEGKLVRQFGAEFFGHDTEGLAIYACGDGGYLVASDQDKKATEFEVFDRESLEHLFTFHLADRDGHVTNATDGIDILQVPLTGFPDGVFAACDGCGSSKPDEMDLIGWGIFPPDFLGDPVWARATVVLADASTLVQAPTLPSVKPGQEAHEHSPHITILDFMVAVCTTRAHYNGTEAAEAFWNYWFRRRLASSIAARRSCGTRDLPNWRMFLLSSARSAGRWSPYGSSSWASARSFSSARRSAGARRSSGGSPAQR